MKYTLSLLFFLVVFTTFGQIPQPIKNTYVNDYAKVLSKSDINNINVSIKQIEDAYGVQLALIVVNKIPKQYDIEEYALLIARKWKVGRKDDGLVYVAAINQHKQRLEVARNLDSIFTPQHINDVLAKTKIHFRAKKYSAGLTDLVSAIALKIDSGRYHKATPVQAASNQPVAESKNGKAAAVPLSGMGTAMKVILGIVVGLILLFISRFFRPRSTYNSGGGIYNNNGRGNNNYSSSSYSTYSNSSSNLGPFAAGAATGFMANELLDRSRQNQEDQLHREQEELERQFKQMEEMQRRASEEAHRTAQNLGNFGNWGPPPDNSGDSSSNSGFSGGGASSDW